MKTDLRAANDRFRTGGSARARAGARGALDAPLPLELGAPGVARTVVADCLCGRVAASVLDSARLVVSELVTNSVCHSGASAGGVVVVRVTLTGTIVRLEVEDRGRGGVVAPRFPDLERGGGSD